MELKVGFNHINNLKDFGKQTPKELKSFNIKESEDSDYRMVAINIARSLEEEINNINGQFELVTQTGNKVSITPFKKKEDFVYEGKFTMMQDDRQKSERTPDLLCAVIYDSILDGFGIQSKYL